MTFAARPHVVAAAAASGVQNLGTMNLGGIAIRSQNFAVSMTLYPDGTIGWINEMNEVQTTPSVVNWYLPTSGGVGSGYRVRFTLQSGTAWISGPTSGTLNGLSAPRQVVWTLPAEGTVTAQVLVEITSSSDTTVLGSGTLVLDMLDEY